MNLIERIAINLAKSAVKKRFIVAKALQGKIDKAAAFMAKDISKAKTLPIIRSEAVKKVLTKGVEKGAEKSKVIVKKAAENPDVAAVYGAQALVSNVVGPLTGNPWTMAIPASGIATGYAAGKKYLGKGIKTAAKKVATSGRSFAEKMKAGDGKWVTMRGRAVFIPSSGVPQVGGRGGIPLKVIHS